MERTVHLPEKIGESDGDARTEQRVSSLRAAVADRDRGFVASTRELVEHNNRNDDTVDGDSLAEDNAN